MRKLRILTTIICLACLPLTLGAQDQDAAAPNGRAPVLRSRDDATQFASAFMRMLGEGKTYEAFAGFKAAIPGGGDELDEVRASTSDMLDQMRPHYGRPIGFELLGERRLGESIIRYDYLLKLERFAVHTRMIFYRPADTWMPARIWFDDELRPVIEEMGR